MNIRKKFTAGVLAVLLLVQSINMDLLPLLGQKVYAETPPASMQQNTANNEIISSSENNPTELTNVAIPTDSALNTSITSIAESTSPAIIATPSAYSLNIPSNIFINATEKSIFIYWDPVEGAESYDISIDNNIKNTSECNFNIDNLEANTPHVIKIRAVSQNGNSEWSTELEKYTQMVAPSNLVATASGVNINLEWDNAPGADSYEIYRDNVLIGTSVANMYTDVALTPDAIYIYNVKAVNTSGNYSSLSESLSVRTNPTQNSTSQAISIPQNASVSGIDTMLTAQITESAIMSLSNELEAIPVPQNITVSATDTTLKVGWDAVTGAQGYDISMDGSIKNITTNYYEFTGLEPDSKHSIKVRAYNPSGKYGLIGDINSDGSVDAIDFALLKMYLFTPNQSLSEEKLWAADVDGSGSVDAIDFALMKKYLTDKSYRFPKSVSEWSETKEVKLEPSIILPAIPANLTVTAIATDSILLFWDGVSGATGYDIEVDGNIIDNSTNTTYMHKSLNPESKHTYRVRAKNGDIAGEWSLEVSQYTLPSMPENIKADISNNSIILNWDIVTGAIEYEIDVDEKIVITTSNSYVHDNLVPGTKHTYKVRTKKSDTIFSPWSESISFISLIKGPTNIKKEVTENNISITWDEVEGAKSYDINFDGNIINTSNTSIKIDDLQPGQVHTVQIVAKGQAKDSEWTEQLQVWTLPDIPVNLTTVSSQSSIALKWEGVNGATGYDVEILGVPVDAGNNTSYINTSLKPNTQYTYRVRAKNESGAGKWSDSVSAATLPANPQNIQSTATDKTIKLTWDQQTGIDSYEIEIDGSKIVELNEPTYLHSGLQPNTEHSYKVRAKSANGTSEWSNETKKYTMLSTPINLSSATSNGSISLRWDAVNGATGYEIFRNDESYGKTSGNLYTDKNTEVGDTYTYNVQAYSGTGNKSTLSEKLTVTVTATTSSAVSIPSNVNVSPTDTTLMVSWDAVMNAQSYDVSLDGTVTNITATSLTYSSLVPNSLHTIKVRAVKPDGNGLIGDVNGDGALDAIDFALFKKHMLNPTFDFPVEDDMWAADLNGDAEINALDFALFKMYMLNPRYTFPKSSVITSGWSDEISKYTMLATPVNLVATPSGISVNLEWNPVPGASGYEVYRNNFKIGTSVTNSYSDSGLVAGVSYEYKVKAFDATGNRSLESQSVSIIISSDTQAPTTPGNLTASSIKSRTANLSWTASTDNFKVARYDIYNETTKLATSTTENCTLTGLTPGTKYTLIVKAIDESGNISTSSAAIIITTLNDDYGDDANFATEIDIGVDVTGAINFGSDVDFFKFTPIVDGSYKITIEGDINTFVDLYDNEDVCVYGSNSQIIWELDAGKEYHVSVENTNNVTDSYILNITLRDTQAPTAPNNLKISQNVGGRVSFTWSAASDNIGVTGYDLYRDGKLVKTVAGDVCEYDDTELNPATTYSYTIIAFDAAGNISLKSQPLSVTTVSDTKAPTAPENLTASSITAWSVKLTWTASSDDFKVARYDIYNGDTLLTTSTEANCILTGLTPGKEYIFTIKAVDAVNNMSLSSNTAKVTTLADDYGDDISSAFPVGLNSEISAAINYPGDVDFFKLNTQLDGEYLIEVHGSKNMTIYMYLRDGKILDNTFNNNIIKLTLGSCGDNTTLYLQLESFDNADARYTYTLEVSYVDKQAPIAPENLVVSRKVDGTAFFTWDATSDNVGVAGYELYRDGKLVKTVDGEVRECSDTGLSPLTTYSYTIKAFDAAGNRSLESQSVSLTTGIDTQAPTAPTNLTVSSILARSANLSWAASTDNFKVARYDIYNETTKLATSTTENCTITGLTPSTKYEIIVKAVDETGYISTSSDAITITTLEDDYEDEISPTASAIELEVDVPAVINFSGDVDFFKIIPAITGSYKISSYNVTPYPKGYLYDSNGVLITSGTIYSKPITVTLTANTAYYLKVMGNSSSSTGQYKINVTRNKPDLVVTDISPLNAYCKTPLTFSLTIKNQGEGATPVGNAYRVGLKIDGGETILWSDINLSSIAVGESATLAVTGGVNGAAYTFESEGTHQITAIADDTNLLEESNETNNTLVKTINIGKADLIVTDIYPTNVYPGQPVKFSLSVKNQGIAATPVGTVHRVGIKINDGDTVLWSDNYTSSITPGATVILPVSGGISGSSIYTINELGTYRITATVDDTNLINESDETNNALTQTLIVDRPDLIVTDIKWPSSINYKGQSIILSAVVKNQGKCSTIPGSSFRVGFKVDGGDTVVWTADCKDVIAPGGTVTLVAVDGISGSGIVLTTSGAITISAYADDKNSIEETNETNNAFNKNLTVNEKPDLIITDITYSPRNPSTGEAVTFSAKITNIGLGNTVVGIKHRVGFKIDGGNTIIWSENYTSSIKSGESVTVTASGGTGGLTWTAKEGAHNITAIVDDLGAINEENEQNNIYVERMVVLAPCDLIITKISLSPANPIVGEPVTISATIKNVGTSLSPVGRAHRVGFKIDGGNTSIWADNYDWSIEPGASVTVTATSGTNGYVWIPAEGIHTITAIADDIGLIYETDEKNNALVKEISVKEKRIFDSNADYDEDGLTNGQELALGTELENPDTDGDGVADGEEKNTYHTDPLNPDTDQDGIYDGTEIKTQTDPLVENPNASVTRQAETPSQNIIVKVNGDANISAAPFQVIESDNILLNSLDGIVGKPAEISLGGYKMDSADVTFKYSESELNGTLPENLTVFWVDIENQKLVPLSNDKVTIDSVNKTITGRVDHFSTYILGHKDMQVDLSNVDIVFSIDQSGSMSSSDPNHYRLKAAKRFVQDINILKNRIGIVSFEDYATIRQSLTNDKTSLNSTLDSMRYFGDLTNILDGLVKSEAVFGTSNKHLKVIILLTDGCDNGSDSQTILNKARDLNANNNIMINTVALGTGADVNLLEGMAGVGNGGYFYINNQNGLSQEQIDAQVELLYVKLVKMLTLQKNNQYLFNPKQKMAIDYADKYLGLDYSEAVRLYTSANANQLTGNYMDQKEDLALDGPGPEMKLERTYNSAAKDVTSIGRGWRLNYDSSLRAMEGESAVSGKVTSSSLNVRTKPYGTILTTLGKGKEVTYISKNAVKDSDGRYWHLVELQDGVKGYVASWYISDIKGIEVTYGSGTKIIFDKDSNGNYVTPYGTFDKLTKNMSTGIYTLTRKDKNLYRYDSAGKLISIEDKNGNKLNITYSSGRLDKVTDQSNRGLTFSYPDSTHIRVTDPANRFVEYVLDANKNLVNVFNPSGQKITYTYYSGTKNGSVWSRLEKELDPNEHQVIKNDYDDFGRLVRQYDANDNIKYHIYRDVYKDENTGSYEKDENDQVELSDSYIDERGFESKVTYNLAEKKPLEEEDSENKKTSHKYFIQYNGQWKDITSMTDTDTDAFYTANWQAIENGNWPTREEITDRNGNTTIYERDERGNVVKITNPDKSYRLYDFDSNDNLWRETDETNKATYYIYDSEGKNLKKIVRPLNGTDAYTGMDDSKFAIINFDYYTDSETNELGYNFKGLVKSITDPEMNKTTYEYNVYGKQVTVTDPESTSDNPIKTTYSYNNLGWKMYEISPDGNKTVYAYDQNGRVVRITQDANNLCATSRITYDELGRKTKEIPAKQYESSLENPVTYSYDGDHGYRYTYYNDGRVHTAKDPENNETIYTYDPSGNLETQTNPNGSIYSFEYDSMNRPIKKYFQDRQTSGKILLEEYSYEILTDHKTQKIKKQYISTTEAAITVYTYDYADRLVSQKNPDNTTISTSYNENGTVSSITDAKGNVTYYKYDGLNRRTEQWTPF